MGFNCGFILHNKKIDVKTKEDYNIAYVEFLDWGRISHEMDTTLLWMGEAKKKYPIINAFTHELTMYEEKDENVNYNGHIAIKASDFISFGLKLKDLIHFLHRFSDRVQNEISEYDLHSLKKTEKKELEDIMYEFEDDFCYEDIFFLEFIYHDVKFLANIEDIDDKFEIIYYRAY